jgi:hypothetical protein
VGGLGAPAATTPHQHHPGASEHGEQEPEQGGIPDRGRQREGHEISIGKPKRGLEKTKGAVSRALR